MTVGLIEAGVEDVALDWLGDLCWRLVHGQLD